MSPLPASLRFTYEDLQHLPEDKRYEIIEGELFMTPSPVPYHQLIVGHLFRFLDEHVRKNGMGEVFLAPCDIVFTAEDVLEPDIFYISKDRLSIIGEKYITEAPDLAVEVLSSGTAHRDQVLKARVYARHGVKEYWIASPEAKTVDVQVNTGEGFRREALFGIPDRLRSPLLSGLEIPLDQVF